MKKILKQIRWWITTYPKIFINALWDDLEISSCFTWFPTIYKYADIKGGEYPGQPKDIIQAQLDAELPVLITKAVIAFLLIALFLYIPILLRKAKKMYGISLYYDFWSISEERSSEELETVNGEKQHIK